MSIFLLGLGILLILGVWFDRLKLEKFDLTSVYVVLGEIRLDWIQQLREKENE